MPKEINLVCMSGQGSVQTLELMAKAYFAQHGKFVASQVSPGSRAKNCPVASMLKVDDKPILAISANYHPTELIVFWDGLFKVATSGAHQMVTDAVGRIRSGMILVNSDLAPEDVDIPFAFEGTVATVDADALLKKHLRREPPPVGMALMGAYCRVSGALDLPMIVDLILEKFPGSVGAKNRDATVEAYETVRIARGVRSRAGRVIQEPPPLNPDAMPEWVPLQHHHPMVGFALGDPGIWRTRIPVCKDTMCLCKDTCISEVQCPDNTGFIVRQGTEAGQGYRIDTDYCRGCGICAEVCVYGALEMVHERQVVEKNPRYEGISVAPFRQRASGGARA